MKEILNLSILAPKKLSNIAKALSVETRIEILQYLNKESLNIVEIAEKIKKPVSSTAFHIKMLEKADLIITELQPGVRGAQKLCSKKSDQIIIDLCVPLENKKSDSFFITMPIGNYSSCNVLKTCGILNEHGIIGIEDKPSSFYNPERTTAQLIWFYKGYLEYNFSNELLQNVTVNEIEISLEICSEAPNYKNNWPSDITMWINGIEIGTWTCPGDFGGRRGKNNPCWWSDNSTQYGLLKRWCVRENGTFLDETKLSSVNLRDINFTDGNFVSVKVGIKDDAKNIGGINIFGNKFGDYDQPIIMRINYTENTEL